jgi:hypothetical protein
MPSIFEKPSLLGFRQEGGRIPIPRNQYSSVMFTDPKDAERYTKAAGDWVDIPVGDPRYDALKRAAESGDFTAALNPTQYFQGAQPSVDFMPGFPGGYASPGQRVAGDREAVNRLADLGLIEKIQDISQPGEPTPTFRVRRDFLEGSYGPPEDMSSTFVGPGAALASSTFPARPAPTPAPTAPVAPTQQPASMFQDTDSATFRTMFPNSVLGPYVSTAPEGTFDAAAPPAGSRAERVAAAMKSGDFETKRAQYNQEAMRLGQPTQMDAQGNIVGRELTEPERMREFFRATGGNTMFSQTTDPAQRALQNEMMKQARAQATVNTFGSTPEERLANLQAETEARQILRSPLNSGVREVAPGVRAATRDGQVIGFSAPGNGSPATMNDPLKKYITNPDGSVSLNPNPPQILMSDEMKDTAVRQGIEGKTGGSPMERGLIAAMQAAEERKKKATK